MKLRNLRLSNFQSFGPEPTEIALEDLTFLIGPNGSGKTGVLEALCRLFAFEPTLKRVQRSDFHVPVDEEPDAVPEERSFWLEADFTFEELEDDEDESTTIPPNFAHMRLDDPDGVPRVRFRMDAKMDAEGEIDTPLCYVLDVNEDGELLSTQEVPRADRNNIQVHYLPARRDPSDHIAYTANSLLGRALRSVNWQAEREAVKDLGEQISEALMGNPAVESLGTRLAGCWHCLHKGSFFADPQVTFFRSEIEALLRHLSVSFSPGHDMQEVDFSRLSDGQKSMLYLSLVLAAQAVGRAALAGDEDCFDVDKLKPAIFTLVAMEEPENSLSPHYLGRIVQSLRDLAGQTDAQALLATHAPSMLRRVAPEWIRYMRLDAKRQSQVSTIVMPEEEDDAHKFVREAVQAFPELYFSRLVVLGEGDSEEVVLPRLLKAKGLGVDETAISVVPLGGRHVNHFWRLLDALGIPYLTLLDLDLARYQGGWGRIKYSWDQYEALLTRRGDVPEKRPGIPAWNSDEYKLLPEYEHYLLGLEEKGVFYSAPLDLDFAMMESFPEAYGVEADDRSEPDEDDVKAVIGKKSQGADQYSDEQRDLFVSYHKIFKLGSKPAAHLAALADLEDQELLDGTPASLARLLDAIKAKLEEIPE